MKRLLLVISCVVLSACAVQDTREEGGPLDGCELQKDSIWVDVDGRTILIPAYDCDSNEIRKSGRS